MNWWHFNTWTQQSFMRSCCVIFKVFFLSHMHVTQDFNLYKKETDKVHMITKDIFFFCQCMIRHCSTMFKRNCYCFWFFLSLFISMGVAMVFVGISYIKDDVSTSIYLLVNGVFLLLPGMWLIISLFHSIRDMLCIYKGCYSEDDYWEPERFLVFSCFPVINLVWFVLIISGTIIVATGKMLPIL